MKAALFSIFGASLLAATVGCDGGSDDPTGPVMSGGTASAGTGNTAAGTGGSGTAGTGTGGSGLPEGVPLTFMEGWVDAKTIGIQGALFDFADATSKAGPPAMVADFTGSNACIKGSAAKVMMGCTPVAPATDCFGTFWGAAIGLNLNQPIDPVTMKGVDPPLTYDGSTVKGFAFKVAGATVPTRLRFKVEGTAGAEYCNSSMKPIKNGDNTFMLSDLITACWKPVAGAATAETAKAAMTKIAWQVYTVEAGPTDFDFCVSDLRVLQ